MGDISELEDEIDKLYTTRNTTAGVRANESIDNAATVQEAQTGLNALDLCIQTLDRFYKENDKNEVNLTLMQGPADDAPGLASASAKPTQVLRRVPSESWA